MAWKGDKTKGGGKFRKEHIDISYESKKERERDIELLWRRRTSTSLDANKSLNEWVFRFFSNNWNLLNFRTPSRHEARIWGIGRNKSWTTWTWLKSYTVYIHNSESESHCFRQRERERVRSLFFCYVVCVAGAKIMSVPLLPIIHQTISI